MVKVLQIKKQGNRATFAVRNNNTFANFWLITVGTRHCRVLYMRRFTLQRMDDFSEGIVQETVFFSQEVSFSSRNLFFLFQPIFDVV